MHCSATADKKTGASSLLFGLSGTGKTTLSADPKRHLIGDDEHCWSDDGIFNIEGGCYAKAINLTSESEPDIFQALRFGDYSKTWSLLSSRLELLNQLPFAGGPYSPPQRDDLRPPNQEPPPCTVG